MTWNHEACEDCARERAEIRRLHDRFHQCEQENDRLRQTLAVLAGHARRALQEDS